MVLARTYTQMTEKHGAPGAAEILLMLVVNLGEEDRVTAARIILARSDRRPHRSAGPTLIWKNLPR